MIFFFARFCLLHLDLANEKNVYSISFRWQIRFTNALQWLVLFFDGINVRKFIRKHVRDAFSLDIVML